MLVFGEEPFAPKTKPETLKLSEKQQKLEVEYMTAAGELQNEYIKGEERSFIPHRDIHIRHTVFKVRFFLRVFQLMELYF